MHQEIIFAGFGGQGIMLMGTVLAAAGMREGLNVTWLPSYGAEQRGGTANCTVVVSAEPIGSPIVDRPSVVVAMNLPSLDKFGPRVADGGWVFINSSLIAAPWEKAGVQAIRVAANELAGRIGSPKVANMVMLGALVARTGLVKFETLEAVVAASATGRAKELAAMNAAALAAGRAAVGG